MKFPECDTNGREYARLSKVKEGDVLEMDAGFDCMRAGAKLVVHKDEHGLYVICDEDSHHLDGQADDGDHLVGMYPVE